MDTTSDTLYLTFRTENLNEGEALALTGQLLNLLQKSPLPVPDRIDQVDKKERKISGYADPLIAAVATEEYNKRELAFVLWGQGLDFSVTLGPSKTKLYLAIGLPFSFSSGFGIDALKGLFIEMCTLLKPMIADVRGRRSFNVIREKYFEWEVRSPHFTFFGWLHYFNNAEYHRQGGEAILENPYITCEDLGEGKFIQVGKSPLDALTPEGEELIVKATRALPPAIKE